MRLNFSILNFSRGSHSPKTRFWCLKNSETTLKNEFWPNFWKSRFFDSPTVFWPFLFIDISKSAHQGVKNLPFLTRNIFSFDHVVRIKKEMEKNWLFSWPNTKKHGFGKTAIWHTRKRNFEKGARTIIDQVSSYVMQKRFLDLLIPTRRKCFFKKEIFSYILIYWVVQKVPCSLKIIQIPYFG